LNKEGGNIETKKEFKRIGTHDGKFHADEIMATSVLKEIFDVELIRTRDETVLDKLDIVYDVGGGEFDHHGVEKVYREDGIPYAASGLIWNKFGKQVLSFKDPKLKEGEIESIVQYIDRNLIEGMDALDNGIWIDAAEIPIMSISSIISGFNPSWKSDKDENEAFNEAVEISTSILNNIIDERFSVLKARDIVAKAFEKRKVKELLILNKYCPYSETLREIDENNEVFFVIYPRKDSYAMQTVRKDDREDKKKLPESWAGKRDEELQAAARVDDAVFCHTGRFIAVAKSFEGIMKMAMLAISESE
jgi:uncharacterized UPF0160 family protein